MENYRELKGRPFINQILKISKISRCDRQGRILEKKELPELSKIDDSERFNIGRKEVLSKLIQNIAAFSLAMLPIFRRPIYEQNLIVFTKQPNEAPG